MHGNARVGGVALTQPDAPPPHNRPHKKKHFFKGAICKMNLILGVRINKLGCGLNCGSAADCSPTGHVIMLMHVNLLFLPASGAIIPSHPIPSTPTPYRHRVSKQQRRCRETLQ